MDFMDLERKGRFHNGYSVCVETCHLEQ